MQINDALDEFDARLLTFLQRDASLTNQQLADVVHLSASQCSRRRQRLEQDGFIKGYRADIDRTKAGLGLTAFFHVTMAEHNAENANIFRHLIDITPAIQEAHALTGEADYLIKVVVGGLEDLRRLVNEVLLPSKAVARVRSEIVLETLSENNQLPLSATQV